MIKLKQILNEKKNIRESSDMPPGMSNVKFEPVETLFNEEQELDEANLPTDVMYSVVKNPSKFWMKNTYIPLDIIFINKHKDNYKIIGYLENMVPKSLESRGIQKKSKYAIEVNAGTIKHLNLKIGDVITLN